MTPKQLAKKHGIKDLGGLRRLINRADEVVENWEEVQPIGDVSVSH